MTEEIRVSVYQGMLIELREITVPDRDTGVSKEWLWEIYEKKVGNWFVVTGGTDGMRLHAEMEAMTAIDEHKGLI